MKILIVAPYFPPRAGGVEHYTYNISKNLLDMGHKITVITSANKSAEEDHGIMIIRIKSRVSISNTPIDLTLVSSISNILRKETFDVVNAHTPVPFYADMAAIASKRMKVPFVLTYHNDVIKESWPLRTLSSIYNKTLLQLTLKSSDRIITPSPYVHNESEMINEFIERTVWIPPGVDTEVYKPGRSDWKSRYGLPENSKIILFVGAMNRGHTHKGVDVLLRAFSMIKDEDTYLVLAGTGDMIPDYKRISESLGIINRTLFTGFIDEETLIDLYRASDMLVLPTLNIAEGFGMVLIEANACGKPVIGSRVGGIKYVIRDGETGLLVPPGDPEALADAIRRLIEDPEKAEVMGQNGRKMVEKNYTWERSSRITEKVFQEVIS
ncbi:glycosyltransferase family 4 protein [Methanothermobacter sp. THM-1]|uniref:glycosyltransferase family 4 protein n=1 Tax=Methanothermobacter sp. THM-1 TaxID=2606911 RepID=UPI001366C631|nr:glycosyltransferase family 4 protein [Methanothermobacter sp. THM-1]QHN06215.1 glycosyltransferase family 4 protein [Methanothermobacter sp. THM-1]